MAMIEKIRNQRSLLMIVLGIGMLGFLVPFDAVIALTGNGTNREVGNVNGKSISGQEYQNAVKNRIDLGFKDPRNGVEGVKNEVWEDMTTDILLADVYAETGIIVTDKEFMEMLFKDIDSGYMSKAFYSNGDEKRRWVNNFKQMLASEIGQQDFLRFKSIITLKRKREKFNYLVNRGVYANSLEGKYDYLNANRQVEFNYVVKLFKNITDSVVNVSESDVMDYYNKHKSDKEFEQNEGRDVTLIKIPLVASVNDIDSLTAELNEIKEDWNKSEDKRTFAETDPDGFIDTLRLSQVETNVDEASFFEVEVGSMVGPYSKGNKMIVANVVNRKMVADTSATVRNILLKAKDVKDANEMARLNTKADSLISVINAGGDFGALAARYSEDPRSKSKGGVYENLRQGVREPSFNDFSFNKRIGFVGSVETSEGVHIIEVLDRNYKVEEAEVALIARPIVASNKTRTKARTSAINLAIDYSNKEDIVTAAENAGYTTSEAVNIIREAKSISGIKNAGELINWIYSAEKGDISQPILADNTYVIALVDLIKEDGEPEFEAVEEKMREGAIKDAQAKYYVELMNGNNLDEIANAVDEPVRTCSKANMQIAKISGSGTAVDEPIVVGSAFSIPAGNMSIPLVGESGIWVIAPKTIIEPEEKTDYLEEQTKLVTIAQNGLSSVVIEAMSEAAEVEDNRN